MRRAGSYNMQAHVLSARAKLGSHAYLYFVALLLSLFALSAFFSAPQHKTLTMPDRGERCWWVYA